ncbi:hypothetical protein FJZ19_04890 [Candidatus Pacearchaeota archaeon]|nr:hypothetical protein [Candidatus Pacearchaeota archaeon]
MKIIEDKQNNLLNRREVKIIVEASKNPSFPEASKIISEHFKAQEELIAVYEIKGKFGRDTFLISASIYKTKEDKNKTEKQKKEKIQENKTEEKK